MISAIADFATAVPKQLARSTQFLRVSADALNKENPVGVRIMRRINLFTVLIVGYLIVGILPAHACRFTPLEWQQTVDRHGISAYLGQRKHITWIRDQNRNFIDDVIEKTYRSGEIVNIVVDLNQCMTADEIREVFGTYGEISYIGKLVTFVMIEDVKVDRLRELAALSQVAIIEQQVRGQIMVDVGTRSIQSRASNTFSPNTAQDAGFNGAGQTIAVLDTGVDDVNHQAFAGKFVAGFNALIYEDTNGNSVDDSCEPAPLGNGSCTDVDDEPANGTTNPGDVHSHGSHVAGIALGATVAATTCSTPDDGSGTNCSGAASGAQLVDIQVCNALGGCAAGDVAEALDWLGINARTFGITVANMSIGFCTDDDGTSAMAQQVNYVAALGMTVAIAHGNSGNCGLAAGTVRTQFPGSASFAITVGGTNDQDTVARTDDTNYTQFLTGPRLDFNAATPNLLALKPDISAPGQNIWSAQRLTNTTYFSQSGTSMATPHVAGAAALVLQAQPTMDPNWDTGLGSGMLDVWTAVNSAAATDVGFPTCVGPPPSGPGGACDLTPPLPAWNNTVDISTAAAPQVGVANTITAQVSNSGPAPATITVNFGVYVFAAGNNQFFHVGTQQVTVAAGATIAVNQPWTPAAANHQCVQVSIDYGLDTNFDNNVTQRNLQVAPSVYKVQIENPFMEPAHIELTATSERDGWLCEIDQTSFTIDPLHECPRTVTVRFDAPPGTEPGERANCNIAAVAKVKGQRRAVPIGGVTVQTFVPRPCRVIGTIVTLEGNAIADARVSFYERIGTNTKKSPLVDAVTVTTDSDGIFDVTVTPYVRQIVEIDSPEFGRGEIEFRPECGVGNTHFVLSKEGIRVMKISAD